MDFVVLILFYGLPLLLLFMFGKVMAGNRPTKLLKTFQKELGGKTRKLGDKYQLEDYELGPCKANLSIWFDICQRGSTPRKPVANVAAPRVRATVGVCQAKGRVM